MNMNVAVCGVCGRREAFFLRAYSGVRLCERCFCRSIEDKVRATISEYGMLRFDDRIAVAVSGGKDSLSMLYILAKIERKCPKSSLVAVTIDEGIKGYRDEALKIARANCQKLGVEHRVTSFEDLYGFTLDEILKKARKLRDSSTACAYCGVLRRKAFNTVARDLTATKIATGHTLDDEVQTILLNIFHGDVLRLAREKPVTDKVHPRLIQKIKPLCGVPERESTLYAHVKGISFQDKPCPYASSALRNDARVMLNRMEARHPGMLFTVFRSIERVRPALEELALKEGFRECSECGEPTAEKTCRTCQMLKALR